MGFRAGSSEHPVPFVLLSTPRSGTSWLMERLASHPQVGAYGEVFNRGVWANWPKGSADRPFFTTYLADRGRSRWSPARPYLAFEYLDYLYAPRRGFHAIGFKLMYGHAFRHPEVSGYLVARRPHVIHLTRNLLDVVVSRRAFFIRSHKHSRSAEEIEDVVVDLDPGALVREIRRHSRRRRAVRLALRAARLPVHEVRYEELVLDDAGLRRVLDFLGIEAPGRDRLSADLLKQAPWSQKAAIANYDEVRDVLVRNGLGGLLRE